MKKYKLPISRKNKLEEPIVAYIIPNSNASFDVRTIGLLNIEKQYGKINREVDFINLIRSGISKKSLDHLIQIIGYSISEIADIIHVSDRHLRRYAANEKLNTEQSERLVELARLYSRGESIFGSMDVFNNWMSSEVLALGNQKPKSFLDTSLGIDMLMNELGRIEHGVYS